MSGAPGHGGAAQLRARHAFALPGGSHDRLIALLGKALPTAIGLIAAVMLLAPLAPRGEVSFLLDRRKVAITTARIDVDRAAYRGTDNRGRLFQVTAGKAVQPVPTVPVVNLQSLAARMDLDDGPATLSAPTGAYDYRTERLTSDQPLQLSGADGYRMTMRNVAVDLRTRTASGDGGVSGAGPSGAFSADRIAADLAARTVTLDGSARLRMVPGQKLRIPQ